MSPSMSLSMSPSISPSLTPVPLVAAVLVVSALAAPATASRPAPDHRAATHQSVTHQRFEHPGSNPYFTLRPGTRTVLRGTDEGHHLREVVTVTRRHRRITGVRTTVVRDVVRRADGSLAERTIDRYATDHRGTVWYFGERTATYDPQGHLESRDGSWRAGRDGARPGIVMPAHPHAGQAYRQELLPGHAEDQAWVVSRRDRVTVPLGPFSHVVRTYEWSRLEPGVMSVKLYGRGVGILREHDIAGGSETFEVVSVGRS